MLSSSDLILIALVGITATLFGMVMTRLKQPALIGYIMTGMLLGPGGFGLIREREPVTVLAELGVILLLFYIGMELHIRDFRRIALRAVVIVACQIGGTLAVLAALSPLLGISPPQVVLFAFCLALSSTAVTIRLVQDLETDENSPKRKIVTATLIMQDLAVGPMLIILAGFTPGGEFEWKRMLVQLILVIALLVGVSLFFQRKGVVRLPFVALLSKQRDLVPLAALSLCFGGAVLAGLIGLSPAFGAFLAGLIVGNSQQRRFIHEKTEPVQLLLVMIFFLSIGLLIDFGWLFEHFWRILLLWLFVTLLKTALTACALRLQGSSWSDAIGAGAMLAQMGEFSFVLGGAALAMGVIDTPLHSDLIILTVLSLVSAPLFITGVRRIQRTSQEANWREVLDTMYGGEWRRLNILCRRASKICWRSLKRIFSTK